MSGYLEIKTNLALNPFKSWKRQWCILRPCPTREGAGSLAVYSSEAGSAAGTVDLPPGCTVHRTKSRSRRHAFAVFSPEDPRKPRVLLAATSQNEAQIWMDKIKSLLNGDYFSGNSIKDSYAITIANTDLSRKCSLKDVEGVIASSDHGIVVSQPAPRHTTTLIPWTCIKHIKLNGNIAADMCTITVDSGFVAGSGKFVLRSPQAAALVKALSRKKVPSISPLSRSEGDLRNSASFSNSEGVNRGSWSSGPSDVSLDDLDLIMSKEAKKIMPAQLSRTTRATHLAQTDDDISADRRSLLSIASGIYEEIPELPVPEPKVEPEHSGSLVRWGAWAWREEPAYEAVECVYATMRRPPPLPPRQRNIKLDQAWGQSSSIDSHVTRHSSLGSLPRCYSLSTPTSHSSDYNKKTKTLPKPEKSRQTFSVFRKRLKSDSRVVTSPKTLSDSPKENKDVETKKKRFDFTPSKDLFKNFRMSKTLMKNFKISSNLSKIGETKSCEFLDETEHVAANRSSKSVECLEGKGAEELNCEGLDDGTDLSIDLGDTASLSLPPDIVELILRGRDQFSDIQLKQHHLIEDHYLPMSPIVVPPPPLEAHYMVMSPRANLA